MYSVFLKSFLLLKDWYRCFHYENVFNGSDITFFSRTVFIFKKPAGVYRLISDPIWFCLCQVTKSI